MGLKPPRYPPRNSADFDRWTREIAVIPDDDSVGGSQLDPDLLAAGEFLVNRGAGPVSGPILAGDIPSTFATDAEVAAAITAHEALANPHPVYLTAAEGNAAYQPLTAALGMIFSGAGNPNTVVTASPGSLYLNTTGGANVSLYVKESGVATNTGWVAK